MNEFPDEVYEALKAYIYRLEDPRTGRTFYVGKGRANRAFAHVRLAVEGEEGLRYDRIRELKAAGLEPKVIIHRHGLADDLALEVEAALIDAYAREDLANEVRGHDTDRGMMTASEIIESYAAAPAQFTVPAILIKIEREWHPALTPDQLYERTRRYWRCRPERQLTPPRYAMSVARGLIREVFDIHSWEDYPDMSQVVVDPTRRQQRRGQADRRGQSRKGFIGAVTSDERLRAALVGKSVRQFPFGIGAPFAYANCGER
jgi:hypothetical protein